MDSSIELIVTVFPDPAQAGQVMEQVHALEKEGNLKLFSSAWISKDQAGNASVKEGRDLDPRRGALFGALVGGLMGLLAGPAGMVIGAAAGAATGSAAAGRIDLGFENKFLSEVQETLKPGTSALLLMLENPYGATAAQKLEELGGKVFRHALRDDLAKRLSEE